MSEQHTGLPVSGYRPQGQTAVDTVNVNKALEELCLRRLDQLQAENEVSKRESAIHDPRMIALARTHMQDAFMWLNRATFQPARVEGDTADLLAKVAGAIVEA